MHSLTRRAALKLGGIAFTGMAASSLAGCAASRDEAATTTPAVAVTDVPVLEDTNFGGVFLDMTIDEFNAAGFSFGDSVDVVFSNGYVLNGIPYHNGYYVRRGEALVVGYPGSPHVKVCTNNGDKLWEAAGMTEADTATVTLAQAGAYATEQEALGVSYTNDWDDYGDDAVFANFRALSGGRLAPGAAYRSASPVYNGNERAAYVEALMAEAGVAYDLDLSDDASEVATFLAEDKDEGIDVSYFEDLLEAECVGMLHLTANYATDEYARSLARGFAEMAEHEGPYLIHCIEGKDRTGFACILLEALAGATYDELQADYMETYANYYRVTREGDPERYQAISNLLFDDMLTYLAEASELDDLRKLDYAQPARDYLLAGGMTEAQIDKLVERLCGA